MRLVSSWLPAVMLVAVIGALAAPTRMVAQGSPTGSADRNGRDPTGAVLPGVMVAARGSRPGCAADDRLRGREWRITALPVGNYELAFELPGLQEVGAQRDHRRSRCHSFRSGDARARSGLRNHHGDRGCPPPDDDDIDDITEPHRGGSAIDSDLHRQLHAPLVVGSWRQR